MRQNKLARRDFLAQSVAGGVAVGFVVPALASDDRELLSLEDFASHQGAEFVLHDATGKTVTAKLVKVRSCGERTHRRQPFSVFFQAASGDVQQDTYTVHHPKLGNMPLFLVPVGPKRDRYLQAVFS